MASVIDYECPFCLARPGEDCVARWLGIGRYSSTPTHSSRRTVALWHKNFMEVMLVSCPSCKAKKWAYCHQFKPNKFNKVDERNPTPSPHPKRIKKAFVTITR